MTRSQPLLLVVATLCLLMVGLAGIWLSVLPQRLLSQTMTRLELDHGLKLAAEKPRMHFLDGPGLYVEAVSLSSGEGPSLDVNAKAASIDLGWGAVFGQMPAVAEVDLQSPVITYEVSEIKRWSSGFASTLHLHDASLRLKDQKLKSVLSVADVNGTWTVKDTGEAMLSLTLLQNGKLAQLKADVANTDRLLSDGSPVDLTWSSDDALASFSGRAVLAKGLQLDGQLMAESVDTNRFAAFLGVGFTGFDDTTPLRLVSGLSISGLAADMSSLNATVGGSAIGGKLQLAAGADQTKLSGALTTDKLPVFTTQSPLLAPWSEKPSALNDLLTFESDVSLQVQDLVLRGRSMGPVTITAKGAGNTSTLTLESSNFAGGIFGASIGLARKASLLALTADMKASGVEAQSALAALLGIGWLSGPLDVAIQVAGQGNSEAAIVSSLAGTVSASSSGAVLTGRDLRTALEEASGPWAWVDGESTSGLNLYAEGTLAEGILTVTKSGARNATLALSPKGEIDLLRQHVSLDVTLIKKSSSAKMLLQGPWAKPAVVPGELPKLREGKDTGKPAKAEVPPAN